MNMSILKNNFEFLKVFFTFGCALLLPCLSGNSFADGQFYGPTISVNSPNQILRFETTLKVPALPPKPKSENEVLFLWPGLQPDEKGAHFQPIGNGVLQPVLTYGVSCAPTQQPKAFASWWISAQYVNTLSKHKQYKGCLSGPSMLVKPGDELFIEFKLNATTNNWQQLVRNNTNGKAVMFEHNLGGQEQNYAEFFIESYRASMNTPLVFTNTRIVAKNPVSGNWCHASNDNHSSVAGATVSDNGKVCSIARIAVTMH
jgi:hypothetical protein